MTDLFDHGSKILNKQPFSVLLGTQLDSLQPGYAVLGLDVRDDLLQQHGLVHGGVISYLADNALTYAGGSVLGDCVTSEFKINYLRPATGGRLMAKARVVSSGKRQAVCVCEIVAMTEEDEKVVAIAQGTISKIIT